ncbi:MAG: DMT family transporter [Candidatus Saccharimonadales bacterium]
MSWQLLATISFLFVAGSLIAARLLARDRANSGASFVINAGAFTFLWLTGLLLLPQFGPVNSHTLSDFFWRLVGGGVAFALTNVATYKSLTYIDAATGTIFNTLNTLFSVGLAAVVLNEDLTAWQAIGGVLLIMAVIYSTLALRNKSSNLSKRALLCGLGFAILAGLIYSVAIVNEKSLLGQMSSGSYIVYGWGWQWLALVIMAVILQAKKFKLLYRSATFRLVVVFGVLRGIGGAAFVLAEVRSNNVALISVISNFKIIVVVAIGAWLLKERTRLRQKAIGALIALAGLSMMFWK